MKKLEVSDFQYLNLLGHYDIMIRGTFKDIVTTLQQNDSIIVPIAFNGNGILIACVWSTSNRFSSGFFEVYTTKNFDLICKYIISHNGKYNGNSVRYLENDRTNQIMYNLGTHFNDSIRNRNTLIYNIINDTKYGPIGDIIRTNHQAREMIRFSKLVNKTIKRYDPYGLLENT